MIINDSITYDLFSCLAVHDCIIYLIVLLFSCSYGRFKLIFLSQINSHDSVNRSLN